MENKVNLVAQPWVLDNQVGKVEADRWGAHSLGLKLPAVNVIFHGLSEDQLETLRGSYTGFVLRKDEMPDIACEVFRLRSPVSVAQEKLTLDGQYAPIIKRNDDGEDLNITGTNFKAKYSTSSTRASSLATANEEELASAGVLENYLRILSAHRVLHQKGVVLHSAGLVFDKKAYVFCGRSNAGKTTLTRKAYEIGARVLSDDINLVLPGKSGYDAYAVPFTGEFGRTLDHAGGKESYPLAGIILLEQSDQLKTSCVSEAFAVARLLTGCPFVNTDEHEYDALFESVLGLVERVPVIRLQNRREDDIHDIMDAVKKQFTNLLS